MAYRDEVIDKLKKQYPYLSSQFGVKRIGLFGSVAKQKETSDSDIDIVVELDKPIGFRFISLVEYLEELFGKKVDVLTKEGIKNIRVKKVSADIEKDILYV